MVDRFLKPASILTLLLLLGWITAGAGLAADPPAAPPPAAETASLLLAIVKVVASLLLVVGLMLLLAHLMKKIGLSSTAIRPGSLIRVLDNRMIAPKRYVAVLEIGGEYVVVGITDQNITLLSRLENSTELEQLLAERQAGRPAGLGSSFAALLHKAGQAVSSDKQPKENQEGE